MEDEQRIARFNEMKQELENEGYESKKCTISVLKANLMAFVTAGPIAIICWLLYFSISSQRSGSFSLGNTTLFLVVVFASMFIHEVLHGVTWALFCKKGWKSIHIGVIWKKLTPFCCCMEPLGFGAYILGGLMPLMILGLGMFGIALITQNMFLLSVSMVNILSAGGDTTIVLMLLKHKEALIMDHPTECGFWAFDKQR